MYKTKICGVDISVGDILEDCSGHACIVYDLWNLLDGGNIVVSFYWINRYGILYDDCVSEVTFTAKFKRKVKI